MISLSPVVTVSLSGDKQIAELLASLPEKHIKPTLRKVLRAAAKPILTAAKLRSPRDSGAMRKALTIRAFKRTRKPRIGFWIGTTQRGSAYGGKAFYAWFVEKGFRIGKRSKTIKAAQNFSNKLKRNPLSLRDRLGNALTQGQAMIQRDLDVKRVGKVLASDKRTAIPGKFFIESAYKDKAEQAKNEILQGVLEALRKIPKVS
jgi:hypothetical protein